MRNFLIIIISIASLGYNCISQGNLQRDQGHPPYTTSDSVSALFQDGVSLYNEARYHEALQIFRGLLSLEQSKNPLLTSSYLMLIKTYLRLGEVENCLSVGDEFLSIPTARDSKYYDDVLYTIGEAYLHIGEYTESLKYFLTAFNATDDPRLRRLTIKNSESIITLFLDTNDIREVRNDVNGEARLYLTLKLAEKYQLSGRNSYALREINSVEFDIRGSYFENDFEVIRDKVQSGTYQKICIGVVLPLTGGMSDIGRSILDGVKYAIYRFQMSSNLNISAIVIDNRGDPVRSIRAVEYLSDNPSVIAIFGPVDSDNAISMAGVANQRKVPMITPTATHSQLTTIGPYIFQANLDFRTVGRFLGLYCTQDPNLKNFSTLSPADFYGKEITDAFCEVVDKSPGRRIILQQWYSDQPEDLKFQFKNIREKGLEIAKNNLHKMLEVVKNSLLKIDTIGVVKEMALVTDSVSGIDQLSLRESLEYLGLIDSTEFKIPEWDTIDFRIKSIDGLFIISHSEDLPMVIPQLEYYNIETEIIGDGNWYEPDILKRNSKFLKGLRFISDYYIDKESVAYRNFEVDYIRKIGHKPARFDIYGYDTMSALLSVVGNGGVTRERMRKGLNRMPTYKGIGRNISFRGGKPRVNSCAFILSFDGNNIEPVAKFINGNLVDLILSKTEK